jgi:hypothetical protein
MKMKLMIAATLLASTVPAGAAVLSVDTGWQDDTLTGAGDPTAGSPWTFTLASGAHLSLTDAFITGDVYVLSGDVTGTSTFFAGPADARADGSTYGSAWLSSSYSHFTTYLGAGTYSFSVTGQGEGGIPAGLALRLDSAVPEPAAWALMITGFGLAGAAMRRRSTKVAFA